MKCPFCKADIEENARFCFYCMTSLEEKETVATPVIKKKHWAVAMAALFVVIVAVGGLLWSLLGKEPEQSPGSDEQSEVGEPLPNDAEGEDEETTSNGTQTTPPNQTEQPKPEDTTLSIPSEPSDETPDKEEDSDPKEEPGSTEAAPSSATYEYRAAKSGDDFYLHADLEDCVVITGVKTPAADGIYRIPSTLDGKKVLAIMDVAFGDEGIRDSVKAVYLPSTVRTVHDYAFASCYNLTDIYFEGNSIYVSSVAFAEKEKRSGTLTIHCPYDCSNRDFRYYRNIAESFFDAEWSET